MTFKTTTKNAPNEKKITTQGSLSIKCIAQKKFFIIICHVHTTLVPIDKKMSMYLYFKYIKYTPTIFYKLLIPIILRGIF